MTTNNILLISDELNLLRTLRRNLLSRGYEVVVAWDEKDISYFVDNLNACLFIINPDFEVLEINGLDIVRKIRERSNAPIIVLSAVGSEDLKIQAMDLGADDYLVMPFGMGEFLARVRVALRRWSSQTSAITQENRIILSGKLIINPDTRQVIINGETIHLTPLEYDLLYYLAKNQGRVIAHRELLREIWGPEYGDEREYLRVFVSQIRKKVEEDPARPAYILTEPRIGYRFADKE
ncbi:winged helix-turn-helix domain-containing protein [Aggregatilinea lenta]|uniref:winged helix-turn-helix domain-containing protein n=1 Tax=Aggregatilinea lenta TaxID=913108 RepID=UPI000E5AEF05|nr:response regulator transcription factor [Aggregatilinea lenta]